MSAPRPPVPSSSGAAAAAGGASRAPPPPVVPRAPSSAAIAAAAPRAAPTPPSINASSPSLASRALASAQSMAAALQASRARVAELEAEIAELRAELSPRPSSPEERGGPSTSSSSAPTGTITLRYSTGWQEAFVHFSRDGRAWTQVPGLKLVEASADASPAAVPGDRELRIEGARRLDFVMTDGRGNWDTPVPSYASSDGRDSDGSTGKASRHYSIEEAGTWRLKSGKPTKLD